MTPLQQGQLVTVTVAGERVALEGIVFQAPSQQKVVVAVPDRARGAVLRTVTRDALTEREEEGANDEALRRLIRRTPSSVRGGAFNSTGTGSGQSGHNRAPAHRPTGR
jgi:alpha-acetolactate decarboxylase